MLSHYEICTMVESAFLPTASRCTIDANGQMTIHCGTEGASDRLTIVGIDSALLLTSRDVVQVVNQLLSEMDKKSSPTRKRKRRRE